MENTNAFALLATLQLPSTCRLLASACCPDKDLVVLISRVGSKDRMSLWKMQGSKKWDVDVGSSSTKSVEIVGVAWSPDGQSIAVAHDPPRITIHSVQDGREERSLTVNASSDLQTRPWRITGAWWFRQDADDNNGAIPDIFKRNGVITGTAHSILKTLPLLDHLQEDAHKVTATDIFAFQGSQTHSVSKSTLPDVVSSWPTLGSDPISASISAPIQTGQHLGRGGVVNDVDDSNVDSILTVTDDLGHMHCFLDGSFPLGSVHVGSQVVISSLSKDQKKPAFFAHPQLRAEDTTATDLRPLVVQLPLLGERKARDLAKVSSTARDLAWYTMRVVKEMRSVWFGSDTYTGAREIGPKWIQEIETRQRDNFGQEDPNPIADLTCYLVTGRASDSILDVLGSGENLGERGIQKWESTVTEAFVKLRDFSERRVAPACQRLHLILEEVLGWSQLPQYALFQLAPDEIKSCLDLAGRAIVISGWLAAVARQELSRFKEFILWLRYVVANPSGEGQATPRHDIPEVNNYFMSGLVVSAIDKWFMGPVPKFTPQDLGVPGGKRDLTAVLLRARNEANDPAQTAWRANVKQRDLSHLDRNLDALMQELATRCQRVFACASGAAARSAVVSSAPGSVITQASDARPASRSMEGPLVIRERINGDPNDPSKFFQYLAMHSPSGHRSLLCMARMQYGGQASNPQIGIAMLECRLTTEGEENQSVDFELLEMDFFDDESVVIVYKTGGEHESTFAATATYNDLGYQELQPDVYVNTRTREDLMLSALEGWKAGHLPSVRVPITRARELITCRSAEVSLAVNGRAGRRVACVLEGSTMEVLDLEGDGDGEGEDDDLDADGEDV